MVFVPYAVLARTPTGGRGAVLSEPAPDLREARLGVAGISAVEIAGEAPRLSACLLAARVLRLVDIVEGGWCRKLYRVGSLIGEKSEML
jgi:hypothetical protein